MNLTEVYELELNSMNFTDINKLDLTQWTWLYSMNLTEQNEHIWT